MTPESKPMSEYKEFHAWNDSLNLAIDRSDLGETKSIDICLYPHKDSLPKLTKYIEYAALTDLQKQVDELSIELDQAKDPTYCALCRSCGIDMCCPAHGCAHPSIKSETLKELKEDNIKLQQQIADYEKALDLVMKNLRYYPGNQNPQGDAEVDAAYNNAEAILAKYRGQNGM